jgi:hypothetical protein
MSLRERKSRGDALQCGGSPLLFIRKVDHQPLAVREEARRGAGKEGKEGDMAADRGWQHIASLGSSRASCSPEMVQCF